MTYNTVQSRPPLAPSQIEPRSGINYSVSTIVSAIVGLASLIFLPWQAALVIGGATFLLTRAIAWCQQGNGSRTVPRNWASLRPREVGISDRRVSQPEPIYFPPYYGSPSSSLAAGFVGSSGNRVAVGGGHSGNQPLSHYERMATTAHPSSSLGRSLVGPEGNRVAVGGGHFGNVPPLPQVPEQHTQDRVPVGRGHNL